MLHLSTNPRVDSSGWNFPLGIAGFRFADLNRVRRIAAVDRVFREELRAADPELAAAYEAYRAARGAGYDPKVESDLIIRTAAFVGPFIARLFHIEKEAEARS